MNITVSFLLNVDGLLAFYYLRVVLCWCYLKKSLFSFLFISSTLLVYRLFVLHLMLHAAFLLRVYNLLQSIFNKFNDSY